MPVAVPAQLNTVRSIHMRVVVLALLNTVKLIHTLVAAHAHPLIAKLILTPAAARALLSIARSIHTPALAREEVKGILRAKLLEVQQSGVNLILVTVTVDQILIRKENSNGRFIRPFAY